MSFILKGLNYFFFFILVKGMIFLILEDNFFFYFLGYFIIFLMGCLYNDFNKFKILFLVFFVKKNFLRYGIIKD